MAVRLGIVPESRDGFAIGWFDPTDDVSGDLCLGERLTEDGADWEVNEAREHNAISERLKSEFPPDAVVSQRLYWDSYSQAKKALAIAKRIWKELRDGRPWPDWAKQASAAGWKPPKGWKP